MVRGLWAESLYAGKDRSSPQWSSGLGREGRLPKLVTERGSRAVSRAVDMAAKSKGRHKVGSRTGLERPMTARYGKAVVKIWQLEPFPAVGPLRALERVRNKRRLAILIGLLQDEG